MGVRRGFGRLRLPYQVGKTVPGSAETRAPANSVLQIHPQARRDRMGPHQVEPNSLQPTNRQNARWAVVVGTNRLERPNVAPRDQSGG
jgi:hypothetical protein